MRCPALHTAASGAGAVPKKKKKIHSEQVSQIDIQSTDVTAIQIRTNSRIVIIIKVYNDNMHNRAIDAISNKWETHENTWLADPSTEIIVLGDFN